MKRAPRRCACGHRIEPGALCPCQRKRIANRPSAHARGYTAEWRREAKDWLARPENRLCACGCGKPAEVVDHKHGRDGSLMWDRRFWRPMTRACNSRKAARFEGGFGNPKQREGAGFDVQSKLPGDHAPPPHDTQSFFSA